MNCSGIGLDQSVSTSRGPGQPGWVIGVIMQMNRSYLRDWSFYMSLILMMAPPEGWPLLAEITESADMPTLPETELIKRVLHDVGRIGILPAESEVIAAHSWICDPAYVVFTPTNQDIMLEARAFLAKGGVTPLGRYGHWEYSSMGQVMRDGHAWAENHLKSESFCELTNKDLLCL